jgi:hypothetical protein
LTAREILLELHLLLGNAVLLPIPLRQKGPQQASWQTITFADTQSQQYRDELHQAALRGGNIGVLLGPASGRLLALDLDDDSLIDKWITRHPWLADTLRTRGQRGCQFWMRLEADCQYPNSKAIFPLKENGKEIGELRSGGCRGAQSVIFGIHPAGMRYQIVVNKSPIEISLADLDELAPGILFPEKAAPQKSVSPIGLQHSPVFLDWTDLFEKRIRPYLDRHEPSITGEGGCHNKTFSIACEVINGFGLSFEEGLEAIGYYNLKCVPPWSEKELQHKVEDAVKKSLAGECSKPRGHLLDDERRTQIDNGRPHGASTPFSKQLQDDYPQPTESPTPEPNQAEINLEEETKVRLAAYLNDPEPFPPAIRKEAFHGIFGKIIPLMSQHCEASPELLLLQGLVILGNIIGRSAYVYGGGSFLFPNEFVVCVGETSRGRKGTAYSMWEHLITLVSQDWLDACISSQTQTGEGIVHRIRDERYGLRPGRKQKKYEPPAEELLDAGVSDKRLLILEEEFSYVLKMAQRSGNTLSETLRQAWDSRRSLSTGNKNSPLKASDPHVSLIGHTTRDELLDTLRVVNLSNGLANRVLWCAARRTGDMPDAEQLSWQDHQDILDWLKRIFQHRPSNTDTPKHFPRVQDAKQYWDSLYRKLNAQKHNSVMDNVLGRDTSHILKIALIFAITDELEDIRPQHLKAALAVVDFCQDSARWIFGQATGDKLANNILWELRRNPAGITRTQINNDIFYRRTPKTRIERALAVLVHNNLATMTMERDQQNHPIERWSVTK